MESEPFSVDRQNFELWHVRILVSLYPDEHAGFPIMMIALPLVERYLRQKSGTYEETVLRKEFYAELLALFPQLEDTEIAKQFWTVYRHGLVHQVSMKDVKTRDSRQFKGWLGKNSKAIAVKSTGAAYEFLVDPVQFAAKIVETIGGDFSTFLGPNSPNHSLARGGMTGFGTGATGPGPLGPTGDGSYGTSGTSRLPTGGF